MLLLQQLLFGCGFGRFAGAVGRRTEVVPRFRCAQQEHLIFGIQAGIGGVGCVGLRGHGHERNHCLFRIGEGDFEEGAVEPGADFAVFPDRAARAPVEPTAVEHKATQKQYGAVLLFKNAPFNSFGTVEQEIVLLIAAEVIRAADAHVGIIGIGELRRGGQNEDSGQPDDRCAATRGGQQKERDQKNANRCSQRAFWTAARCLQRLKIGRSIHDSLPNVVLSTLWVRMYHNRIEPLFQSKQQNREKKVTVRCRGRTAPSCRGRSASR